MFEKAGVLDGTLVGIDLPVDHLKKMRGNISFSEAHIEQDIVHQIFDYYSQPSKASLIKLQKVRILFMNKRVISPKSFST